MASWRQGALLACASVALVGGGAGLCRAAEAGWNEGIRGRVFVGYQGWFSTPTDGSGIAWKHYGRVPPEGGQRRFEPGISGIEMWPDMGEAEAGERHPTPFVHADGSVAEVFSSFDRGTVARHVRWMGEYGIDGLFLQRFGASLRSPELVRFRDTVMGHVREAAAAERVAWALMYDLTGLREGEIAELVIEDFKRLRDEGGLADDPAHLRLGGRPLIGVWGVGFSDGRRYTVAECEELVDFLKDDPVYGGNAVLLGVPFWWRRGDRDGVGGEELEKLLGKADVISPWSVGRVRSPEEAGALAREAWAGDVGWCERRGIEWMPVIYPGFRWDNLKAGREGFERVEIPRRRGELFWRMGVEAVGAGARTLYLAMFDELDEGTALFKVSDDPPVGATKFLGLEGLPSDAYLRWSGQLGEVVRGEREGGKAPPRTGDQSR